MSDPIRVLIVDDHVVVAEGLELALRAYEDVTIIGRAVSGAEAIAMAAERTPDVILMDHHLPDAKGAEIASRIHAAQPSVVTVVLTADTSDAAVLAAIEAGAAGLLVKTRPASEIVGAIRRAAQGEMVLDAERLRALIEGTEQAASAVAKPALTAREHEVLELVARGLDNKAIAAALGIGLNTVRYHIQNILQKLGAHSRLEAVARATAAGLLGRPAD